MKLTKNVKKITMAFICAIFLFSSVAPQILSATVVRADFGEDVANTITDFILSVTGAAQRGANAVVAIPRNIRDNVVSTVYDYLQSGDGIYQDQDGNYVFTNDALNDIYQALDSNSSIDARVVGNFGNFNNHVNSDYTNLTFATDYANILAVANSLVSSGRYSGYFVQSVEIHKTSGAILTQNTIFLIPNEGCYLYFVNNGEFMEAATTSSNGEAFFDYLYCAVKYDDALVNPYELNESDSSDPANNNHVEALGRTPTGNYLWGGGPVVQMYGNRGYTFFPNIPNITTWYNWSEYYNTDISWYCTDASIVAQSASAAQQLLKRSEGVFYNNVVTTNNTYVVSNTVINNTNWSEVYNTYITNINNDYQQGMDFNDFQKLIKKYTKQVTSAVEQGASDIQKVLLETNQWLDMINGELEDIKDYLEDVKQSIEDHPEAWTTQDVTRLLQILERFYLYSDDYKDALDDIDANTDGIEGKLDLLYNALTNLQTYLSNIQSNTSYLPTISTNLSTTSTNVASIAGEASLTNSKLGLIYLILQQINNKIGTGGGGGTSNPDAPNLPNVDPDTLDWLSHLDEYDISEIFSPMEIAVLVLQTAAPFCYLVALGGIISALGEEPEAPRFEEELYFENLDLRYNFVIDFEDFENLSLICRAFFVIMFCVSMTYLCIWLIRNLLDILY